MEKEPHFRSKEFQSPLAKEPDGFEQIFNLMVDAAIDYAIYELDAKGNIVSWNKGAERIKGYKADEVIGRHFSIFPPKPQLL